MKNRTVRISVFLSILTMLLVGCWAVRPLLIASTFATFTLPILKYGRTAAVFTLSNGKFAFKVEREFGKHGIKAGVGVPLASFQDIGIFLYRALYNGELPPAPFDATQGVFIIIDHNGEKTFYVSEHNETCVANVTEPQVIHVSMNTRTITIPVTSETTELLFGATDAECKAIGVEIEKRKHDSKEKQDKELKSTMADAVRAAQAASEAAPTQPVPTTPSPEPTTPVPAPPVNFDVCKNPAEYLGQTNVVCWAAK